MTVRIRSAVGADAPWLSEVSRDSFPPRLHPYLVSAQPGIGRYWGVVIENPASFRDRSFLVAETADGVRTGFAEFQRVGSHRAHLSYVCVVESARGRGIASTLLQEYVHRHPEVDEMQLDVFAENVAARSLYQRLGFSADSTTTWWATEIGPDPDVDSDAETDIELTGLHGAKAWADTYGFGEFAAPVRGKPARFGRPSPRVLRCFEPEVLMEPRVLRAIAAALPGLDQVLVITPGEEPPSSAIGTLRAVNRSTRMSVTGVRATWEVT